MRQVSTEGVSRNTIRRRIAMLGCAPLVALACRTATPAPPPELPFFRAISRIDTVAGTVVLPVFRGVTPSGTVWYIVTESSSGADAIGRGVTWAPRLALLAGTRAVQKGDVVSGTLHYVAGVDFTPERIVRPQPDSGFPALEARPGAVAEPGYSSFVELRSGVVINAPIVASERGVGDRVVSLDSTTGHVTLRMSRGYHDDRHAWYISTEASDPQVAAYERATWAPALGFAPTIGSSTGGSARSGILSVVNGVRERGSPDRQGMQSALVNDLSPLNVLEHAPSRDFTDNTYSPLWDLQLMRWTSSAIESDQREKIFSWSEGIAFARRGLLVSAMSTSASSTPRALAAGVVINCPVMITFAREARP